MTFELGLPGARAVFSTRSGGVSEGPYESLNLGILTGDDPDRVGENRRRLAERIGVDPERVAMGWQVHGAGLHEQEVAGPCLEHLVPPGAELHPERARENADHRLVLAVVVPTRNRAGRRPDQARPHAAGGHGLLAPHPGCRRTLPPVVRPDQPHAVRPGHRSF